MTDDRAALTAHLNEHRWVARQTQESLGEPFVQLAGMCRRALQRGNKLLLFGNGGSAADAQHLAAELVVRFRADRRPYCAIALTTDTSILTAIGNDLGYEYLFARQIEALGEIGDVAIGLSTSGKSRNVIMGLRAAKRKGLETAGFTGQGGKLWHDTDLLLSVPSDDTAHIQEMHIVLGHALCEALE